MPRHPTTTEIRLSNTTANLIPTITLLKEINNAFDPPFIQPISNIIQTLINAVQNVKRNKNDCSLLMENIHQVLYAIINLYIRSETAGSLPPAMLDNIGKFTETLHKIYVFVEAQQDGNKLKHIFRNSEMQNLLKDCRKGLDQAMEVFLITTRPVIYDDIGDVKIAAKIMHERLLEEIQTLSDASTSSERVSPKIFHGREAELESIMKLLIQQSPRIAILGGGGMGKTSLARATLHHLDTSAKFEDRFFVSAESATSRIELAALIGLHVGLNPGQDLTKPVVQYFSRKPPCLLILDNLETAWEPIQSRGEIEELLSLLADVEHLALIITMRGTEQPAKIRWTRPFLLPLQPLSDEAAKQTLLEITDNVYAPEDIHQILQFTDNMPLAVDLIAHLLDYEGLSNVLTRWKTEKTALLSVGYDRKSNMNASIMLSLSSPRITPDSQKLLSLLSILPDGLSDSELVQSTFPIPNILSCKTALLATSMAYQDCNNHLRSLVPIREYMQQFLPPLKSLIQCLCNHFHALLELYQKYPRERRQYLVNQITSNLGNMQAVLQQGLHNSASSLTDTIYCILSLNLFYRLMGRSPTVLMDNIQPILAGLCEYQLEIQFITEVLLLYQYRRSLNPEQLLPKGIALLKHISNPLFESKFYNAAGHYSLDFRLDTPQALLFFQKALELSKLCGDSDQYSSVLLSIALLKYRTGNYYTAQEYATEAQRLSKLSGNLFQESRGLRIGAMCSTSFGNFEKSMNQLHRGKEILSICGMSGGDLYSGMITAQAETHLLKSEYSEARKIYSQMVETTSPEKSAVSYALSLLNIALIDTMIGADTKDVNSGVDRARKIFRDRNLGQNIKLCSVLQAAIEFREENFTLAKIKFQECLYSVWGADHEAESFCLERLADIRAWPVDGWCYQWPAIYLGHAYKSKDKLAIHKAFIFLGDMFIADKDEETASNLYMIALDGFTHMDVHCSRAKCMIRLGDLAKGQGYISKAIALWKAAQPLFERSSQAKDVAQIDSRFLAVEKDQQIAFLKPGTLNTQY